MHTPYLKKKKKKKSGLCQTKGSTEFGASVLNRKACLEGHRSYPKILKTGWPERILLFWKEAGPNQWVQQRVTMTFKSLLMIPHSLERSGAGFLRSLGWLLATNARKTEANPYSNTHRSHCCPFIIIITVFHKTLYSKGSWLGIELMNEQPFRDF